MHRTFAAVTIAKNEQPCINEEIWEVGNSLEIFSIQRRPQISWHLHCASTMVQMIIDMINLQLFPAQEIQLAPSMVPSGSISALRQSGADNFIRRKYGKA